MRESLFIPLLILIAGLPGCTAPSSPSEEEGVEVRVNGSDVHFRKSVPQTDQRADVERYADEDATYIAFDKDQGRVEGYAGDFFHLENKARGDRGWVAAPFVEINEPKPGDQQRLAGLGAPSPAARASELQWWENVLSLLVNARLLGTMILALMILLIGRLRKDQPSAPAPPKADAPPSDVHRFPRAVSSTPPSVELVSQEKPKILYGSGWVYRPRR